jgi:hypothetical protein
MLPAMPARAAELRPTANFVMTKCKKSNRYCRISVVIERRENAQDPNSQIVLDGALPPRPISKGEGAAGIERRQTDPV